jgi:hypothetical protein
MAIVRLEGLGKLKKSTIDLHPSSLPFVLHALPSHSS